MSIYSGVKVQGECDFVVTEISQIQIGDIVKVSVKGVCGPFVDKKMWPVLFYFGFFIGVLL